MKLNRKIVAKDEITDMLTPRVKYTYKLDPKLKAKLTKKLLTKKKSFRDFKDAAVTGNPRDFAREDVVTDAGLDDKGNLVAKKVVKGGPKSPKGFAKNIRKFKDFAREETSGESGRWERIAVDNVSSETKTSIENLRKQRRALMKVRRGGGGIRAGLGEGCSKSKIKEDRSEAEGRGARVAKTKNRKKSRLNEISKQKITKPENIITIPKAKKERKFGWEHQKKIALATLKMSKVGAQIMGGMTHAQARHFLDSNDIKYDKKNLEEAFVVLFNNIKPGHTVHYLTPQGQSRKGRVVMNRGTHLVLNRGNGQPQVVTPKNFIKSVDGGKIRSALLSNVAKAMKDTGGRLKVKESTDKDGSRIREEVGKLYFKRGRHNDSTARLPLLRKKEWLANFEKHVVSQNEKHAGRIDWDTAHHMFNIGKEPKEAADKYLSIKMKKSMNEASIKYRKSTDDYRVKNKDGSFVVPATGESHRMTSRHVTKHAKGVTNAITLAKALRYYYRNVPHDQKYKFDEAVKDTDSWSRSQLKAHAIALKYHGVVPAEHSAGRRKDRAIAKALVRHAESRKSLKSGSLDIPDHDWKAGHQKEAAAEDQAHIHTNAPVNIGVRSDYAHHYTTKLKAYSTNSRPQLTPNKASKLAKKDAYEFVKNKHGQESHDKLKQWHDDNSSGKNDHLYEKENTHVIYSKSEDGFWSNKDGWGDKKSASKFNPKEFESKFKLPMSAKNDAKLVAHVKEDAALVAGKKMTKEQVNMKKYNIKEAISLKILSKKYDKNEDENNHSENAVLLAKHFGTPDELKRMQHMLKTRNKIGHLHSDHTNWSYEMSKKYVHKLREGVLNPVDWDNVETSHHSVRASSYGGIPLQHHVDRLMVAGIQSKPTHSPHMYHNGLLVQAKHREKANKILFGSDLPYNPMKKQLTTSSPTSSFQEEKNKVYEAAEGLPPIHQIAREIKRNWKNVHYAAAPYLSAMHQLETRHDNYGMDSGSSVVAYGLSNMRSYSGKSVHDPALAKKHREQLKAHLKAPKPIIGEAKIEKITAREILDKNAARGINFFTLRRDQVQGLVDSAKDHGYRKHKLASGSTGRMFHKHLHRIIGEEVEAKKSDAEVDTAKKSVGKDNKAKKYAEKAVALAKAKKKGKTADTKPVLEVPNSQVSQPTLQGTEGMNDHEKI